MEKRIIKFRGQRIDNIEWVYGEVLSTHQKHNPMSTCIFTDEFGPMSYASKKQHNVRHETVTQFTGLQDKAGKDIYEGDIVKCYDHPTDMESATGSVYFECGAYRVTGTALLLSDFGTAWTEIIGNIFSNPELLSTTPVTQE